VLLPFGYLWFRLINNLRPEWATNPQYSYGWVVPFLCVAFLLQRWQWGGGKKLKSEKLKSEMGKEEAGEEKLKTEILKAEMEEQTARGKNVKAEMLKTESATSKAEIGKAESGNESQISAFQRVSVSAFRGVRPQESAVSSQISALQYFSISAFCLLAFMYLPTRLIEEATPEWRPIQWSLGFEAVGLTLCAVYLAKGWGWLRQVAFPLCFFFVAIPWPTVIEAPVIQSLTRINSAVTVELLGWFGIPAIQHGNLIEVSTGTVGVSEACSGIRSFQTSLMVSLFFGEFYAMGLWRRLLLIPAGFMLAMAFNVCRMSFLTMVAARKGVAAIAQYHDPAGIAITITCTLVLWGVSVLLKKKLKTEKLKTEMGKEGEGKKLKTEKLKTEMGRGLEEGEEKLNSEKLKTGEKTADFRTTGQQDQKAAVGGPLSAFQLFSFSAFQRLGFALLVWLVAVEVGSELWYRHLELHLAPSPKWSVEFPTNDASFETSPIGPDTANLLRFDEGKQGAWQEADGTRWQAFYFNWWPGRVAGYLAKRHTPEACLPAAGWKLRSGPEMMVMNIKNIELPMRHYVFENSGGDIQVFQCRWEEGMSRQAYVLDETSEFNLVRGIWAGRGNHGQKVIEFIISGYGDSNQAKAAFERQLQTMIKVETLKS
jgi:exosortase